MVKPYVVIQTGKGKISFGRQCAISSFGDITNGENDVMIGDYVRIGPSVTIIGGYRNFKRRDLLIIEQGSSHQGLRIGDDVLIGAGSVILPGCHIEKGVVVGAGSVVKGNVPSYAIVAGAPAKIVGERK